MSSKGTNEYSVVFLYAHNGEDVLLIHKKRSLFKGRFNGVGGHRELPESIIECAYREVEEETGIRPEKLTYIATLMVPNVYDSPVCGEATLFVYVANVSDEQALSLKPREGEDEELEWVKTVDVLNAKVTDKTYAGNGDLLYFVYAGIRALGHRLPGISSEL